MRLPGFTAEAGLNRSSRRYNPAGIFTNAVSRTAVEMAFTCDPNAPCGMYTCATALYWCQYYAAATSHSGADVSGCCSWWVSCCEFHPPSSGGGGGGNGGPPPHHGPVAQ